MAKYNRFIKCKSLNIRDGHLEDVIINIDNIDSIFPSKVVDGAIDKELIVVE